MATPEQVGARIRAARLAAGLGVKNAAEQAGVARDTWYRIESGKPGQDTKRHAALSFFGLDADGLPLEEGAEPVTADTLDARLANLDRQVDALWKRIEVLERRGDLSATADLTAEAVVVADGDEEAPVPDLQRRRDTRKASDAGNLSVYNADGRIGERSTYSTDAPREETRTAARKAPRGGSEGRRRRREHDESYEINQDPGDA